MDEISNQAEPAPGGRRTWVRGAALAAAGLLAGGVLAGTLSANAQSSSGTTSSPSTSSGEQPAAPPANADQSKPQRSDETLLTGSTAEKVRAAALAKYPGATIQRVETDSDGVYEAHLVTAAGDWVTVEVGKDFTVTGTEARPSREHGGGEPPNGQPPGESSSATPS
jgi:hypothetical protein